MDYLANVLPLWTAPVDCLYIETVHRGSPLARQSISEAVHRGSPLARQSIEAVHKALLPDCPTDPLILVGIVTLKNYTHLLN